MPWVTLLMGGPCPLFMTVAPFRSSQPQKAILEDSSRVYGRLRTRRGRDIKKAENEPREVKPTNESDRIVFWKESCKGFRRIYSWSDTSDWQASQMHFVWFTQQLIKPTVNGTSSCRMKLSYSIDSTMYPRVQDPTSWTNPTNHDGFVL